MHCAGTRARRQHGRVCMESNCPPHLSIRILFICVTQTIVNLLTVEGRVKECYYDGGVFTLFSMPPKFRHLERIMKVT